MQSPDQQLASKRNCLQHTVSQGGLLGAFGVGVGFFKAHEEYKRLTLQEKLAMTRLDNFRRTLRIMSPPVALFAAAGSAFAATECLSERLIGKQDARSGILGGFAAGAVVGLARGNFGSALGASLLFALGSVTADFFTRVLHPRFDDIEVSGPLAKPGEVPPALV